MQQQLHLGQGAQCYVILKEMRLPTVVGAHLPNALPTQRLDNLRVSHKSQVTRCRISYKAVFFSSTTITGETFNCAKRYAVVREEGRAEVLFDKETSPPSPEIQISTAPQSAPGDPIKASVFNTSNWAEDFDLVRNQGLEVYDDMETDRKNVTLFESPAADTLFEG